MSKEKQKIFACHQILNVVVVVVVFVAVATDAVGAAAVGDATARTSVVGRSGCASSVHGELAETHIRGAAGHLPL